MIYGTPAGSLAGDSFGTLGNRTAGAAGERLTAAVLNGYADRSAVFHDLNVPGYRINADHAVLAGNRLLIIDSKVWTGGKYWSFGEWHFRGMERRPNPSKAVAMAREAIADYLRPHRIRVVTPLVVLWSGGQATGAHVFGDGHGRITGAWAREESRPFIHFRYPGGKAVPGNDLARRVHHFTHHAPAPNPGAVEALTRLLH